MVKSFLKKRETSTLNVQNSIKKLKKLSKKYIYKPKQFNFAQSRFK